MRYILLFLIITLKVHSYAQIPVLQHFGVDDGLAGSCVYRTIQDSKGFIWLMTDRGLSRFDGSRFQNFTMADGLPQNDVFLVGEDRHQRLWIYAWNDIFCYYDLNKNRFYTIPNSINVPKQGFINNFFDTDTGVIVSAHGSNIYKINAQQEVTLNPHIFNTPNGTKKFWIQRQYPMITGELVWYEKKAASDSIASLVYGHDLPTKIIYYQVKSPNNNKIALADSALFVQTGDWLHCYYKNKHVQKHLTELLPSYASDNTINQFDVVGGNTRFVYIKTPKDCFIVDENLNRQNVYNFIKELDINGVNADKDGNFWISTKENGVYLLEKNVPKKLKTTQLTTNSVKSIVKDAQGNVIIGNNLGEIHILKQGKLSKILFDKPINFQIKTLKALPDGRVCVSWKDFGFTILSPQQLYDNKVIKTQVFEFVDNSLKIQTKGILPLIACLSFKDIGVSSQNDIVFATRRKINLIRDSANYWVLSDINAMFGNQFVLMDKSNSIWVSKSSGLWLLRTPSVKLANNWDLDSLIALKKQYPILNQPLIKVIQDRPSRLWVATGVGLNRLQTDIPTKIMTLQNIPELASDMITQMYVDAKNKLWVASNKGISNVIVNNEQPFQYTFRRLNVYPWLPSLEINNIFSDSLNLYIGTPQGLTVLAMNDLFEPKFSQNKLPLVITSIKINKQDTTIQNNYRLSYNQNTIDISFAAINFQSIKDIRFQYRMITPLSKDSFWHDVSDFHKEFAYLEEGSYRFYLRATNMNENMTTLSEPFIFYIAAPFWRQGWFVLLTIFLLAGSIWAYSRGRVNKIKTEEIAKTAINKQFADLELRALQAQMNPHFIFNALTASRCSCRYGY